MTSVTVAASMSLLIICMINKQDTQINKQEPHRPIAAHKGQTNLLILLLTPL